MDPSDKPGRLYGLCKTHKEVKQGKKLPPIHPIRRQNEVERFSQNSWDSHTSYLKYLQDGSGKQHKVQGDRWASMKLWNFNFGYPIKVKLANIYFIINQQSLK